MEGDVVVVVGLSVGGLVGLLVGPEVGEGTDQDTGADAVLPSAVVEFVAVFSMVTEGPPQNMRGQ